MGQILNPHTSTYNITGGNPHDPISDPRRAAHHPCGACPLSTEELTIDLRYHEDNLGWVGLSSVIGIVRRLVTAACNPRATSKKYPPEGGKYDKE